MWGQQTTIIIRLNMLHKISMDIKLVWHTSSHSYTVPHIFVNNSTYFLFLWLADALERTCTRQSSLLLLEKYVHTKVWGGEDNQHLQTVIYQTLCKLIFDSTIIIIIVIRYQTTSHCSCSNQLLIIFILTGVTAVATESIKRATRILPSKALTWIRVQPMLTSLRL